MSGLIARVTSLLRGPPNVNAAVPGVVALVIAATLAACERAPAGSPDTPAAAAGKLGPGAPGRVINGDLRGAAPETLVGLGRVSVGVERSGSASERTIRLEADYRSGDRRLTLQIVYSPSIAQVIGFGGVSTLEYDRTTPEGYSRRRRDGELIIAEDWNAATRTGSYGRLAQDRFYVRASGRGVKPDDLRSVVDLFGQETLAQFAAGS